MLRNAKPHRDHCHRCHARRPAMSSIYSMTAASFLVLGGALLPARSALAGPLPAQPAPAGFQSVNNSGGGRILTGALPEGGSEQAALHAGLRRLGSYFGGTLEITSALRSRDDQATTVFFRANLKGTPVTGISIIAFSDKGSARESVLFDTSSRFSKTLPELTLRLKTVTLPVPKGAVGSGGAHAAAVSIPPLHPHRAPDNTIGVSVPDGWKIVGLGDGRAAVQGPDKQFVSINNIVTFMTADSPRAKRAVQMQPFMRTKIKTTLPIAPFTDDIGQDYVDGLSAFFRWKNVPDPQIHLDYSKITRPGWAVVSGTRVDDGIKSRFVATVAALDTGSDSWILVLWAISGPSESFDKSAPTMMAIENSHTYNAEADRKQKAAETAAFIAASRAAMALSAKEHEQYMAGSENRFQSSMAAARASQDSIDRAAAGTIHLIQGSAVLEHTTTGFRGSLDAGWAQSIAEQDPQHYQVVPMKDYVKGVDY